MIMAHTQSWAFPKLFDVARNTVSVLNDGASVSNRVRLLMLTEPTELYNMPRFSVGLKRHMFQYNTENEKAIMKDRIIGQLKLFEPCVIPEDTHFADGLLFTEGHSTLVDAQDYNRIKLTVGLACVFGETSEVVLSNE